MKLKCKIYGGHMYLVFCFFTIKPHSVYPKPQHFVSKCCGCSHFRQVNIPRFLLSINFWVSFETCHKYDFTFFFFLGVSRPKSK